MDILIEYAKLECAESYSKAVDQVARERKYLAGTEGFPIESTKGFVEMIVKNNFAQYYAVQNGEVLGWCDVLPKSFEGMRHVGVLGMGILSNFRGQGIGALLLKKTMEHATRLNGITKIELEVFASNVNAISLYTKYGFVIEGKRVDGRKLDGISDDIILMGMCI